MDLVSYRGPGVAGGVSSGLGRAWKRQSQKDCKWWFLDKGVLEVLSAESERSKFISLLSDSLVQGHYRYCNEFLWPLMHDLPQYAVYSPEQKEQYNTFNRLLAEQIDVESLGRQEYFIQDYQLGIAPSWLSLFGHHTIIFWHIPWPKHVPFEYLEPICELAVGLLGASTIGFHTQEYAQNFLNFVSEYLPGYRVNARSKTIESASEKTVHASSGFTPTKHKSYVQQTVPAKPHRTTSAQLVVHPLGIDFEFWRDLSDAPPPAGLDGQLRDLAGSTFVLSVDRADYTKSVLDRLLIIDKFFERHPQWIAKLRFIQVCGRTRIGLPSFDQYWYSCRSLAGALNARWRQDNWQPLHWVEGPLSTKELAYLYTRTRTMLVNPVRDGLNLTAKEFVASQGQEPGTLLLSDGAGAFHELGEYALRASPEDHENTIASLQRSLTMSLKERQARILAMKTILIENQLEDWWLDLSRVTRASDIPLIESQRRA
jgi:trehalose 6-phosphate synthase/phosphatase